MHLLLVDRKDPAEKKNSPLEYIENKGKLKQSNRDWVRGIREPPSLNETHDDFQSTMLTQLNIIRNKKMK